jgi:serine/threonine-protein kinase RsbW
LSIPSALSAVEPVCEKIRSLLEKRHLERMRFQVEMVARECLNNAILHGNRARAGRVVKFAMRVGRRLICLRIADQGAGFDWRARKRCWPADSAASGRGLMVARAYAERMAFNRRGNQVTVWIHYRQEGR